MDEQFAAEPIDMGRGEIAEAVAAAIQGLPPLQREVLVLAEYENCRWTKLRKLCKRRLER